MLNDRQLKILTLILKKKYSGNELAELLNSSRRTIVRDMSIIEFWLKQEEMGVIDNKNGYSVITSNEEKINSLLNSSENEKHQLIYLLLTHDYMAKDELLATLHITNSELVTYIENLNDSYAGILHVDSKFGKGYFVNETDYHKIDLLANLLSFNEKIKKQAINDGHQIKRVDDKKYSKVTSRQLQLQALACQLVNKEEEFQEFFENYWQDKLQRIERISHYQIIKILAEVNKKYHLIFNSHELSEKLYGHLERNVLFPTYFQDDIYDQIQTLKLNNPFVFDFSEELATKFEQQLLDTHINYEYIALYLVENRNSIHNQVTNLVLVESRYSIANINSMLINDQIKDINLEVVHRKDELTEVANDSLLIAAEDELDKFDIRNKASYAYRGILETRDIDNISKLINQYAIEKNMDDYFGKKNTYSINSRSKDFFDSLKMGIDYFKRQDLMTAKEGNNLFQRELEGNQLVVNHLSIPHITSDEIDADYRLLYTQLDNAVRIEGEEIYGILIVIVNQNISEHTQMFSYLYNKISKMKLEPGSSYNEIISYLK